MTTMARRKQKGKIVNGKKSQKKTYFLKSFSNRRLDDCKNKTAAIKCLPLTTALFASPILCHFHLLQVFFSFSSTTPFFFSLSIIFWDLFNAWAILPSKLAAIQSLQGKGECRSIWNEKRIRRKEVTNWTSGKREKAAEEDF